MRCPSAAQGGVLCRQGADLPNSRNSRAPARHGQVLEGKRRRYRRPAAVIVAHHGVAGGAFTWLQLVRLDPMSWGMAHISRLGRLRPVA